MGNNHEKFFSKNKRKILVLGLSDSGKTTLVNCLQKIPSSVSSKQTIKLDLQITDFKVGKFTLCLFDMGGAERARIFWRQNYFGTQGIIYLIDASKDIENIGISLKELEKVVIDPDLNDNAQIPIAIFVNNAQTEKDNIANNIVHINKAIVNMKMYQNYAIKYKLVNLNHLDRINSYASLKDYQLNIIQSQSAQTGCLNQ